MREDYFTTDLAGAAQWQRNNAVEEFPDVDYDDVPHNPDAPASSWLEASLAECARIAREAARRGGGAG